MTPHPTILALPHQERDTQVTSSAITVTGIDSATDVSITGGEFAIGGGTFITSGRVVNGETIVVRGTSSSDFSASVDVVLTVGGVSGTFTITTEDQDITPATFSFTDVTDAPLSTLTTSNAITITDINDAAPISINGGEYSIDGGAFTNAAGTVNEGQMVVVQATSSDLLLTETNVVLIIGSVEETFSITTIEDNEPPQANISFPSPVSFTEADSILVRGTSEDIGLGVASARLNGMDVQTSDDFATWQIEVPLILGDNTLSLEVMDNAGNEESLAVSVLRVEEVIFSFFFPDNNELFSAPSSLALDLENGRAFVGNSNQRGIIEVDLSTGGRTVFSDNSFADTSVFTSVVADILLSEEIMYIADHARGFYSVSLNEGSLGERTWISGSTANIPDDLFPFSQPHGIILDPNNAGRAFIADGNFGVTAVDLNSGSRSVFSSSNIDRGIVPNSDAPIFFADGIAYDSNAGRLLVANDSGGPILVGIDPESGSRQIIAERSDLPMVIPEATQILSDIVFSSSRNSVFVSVNIDVGELEWRILEISLTDGAVSIIADNISGINDIFLPRDLYYDEVKIVF